MDDINNSENTEIPSETSVQTPVTPVPVEQKPVAPTPVSIKTATTTSTTPSSTTTDKKETTKPTTSAEEDRHSKSQRTVNYIWEVTQSILALSLIWIAVGSAVWMVVYEPTERSTVFLFLSNMASNVIGFYFGRTNHQRVGGVQTGR